VYRLEWAKGYPIAFEEWEKDAIPQLKVDALDRLVAAGKIRDIDREHVDLHHTHHRSSSRAAP
jgi:hypothetical protein